MHLFYQLHWFSLNPETELVCLLVPDTSKSMVSHGHHKIRSICHIISVHEHLHINTMACLVRMKSNAYHLLNECAIVTLTSSPKVCMEYYSLNWPHTMYIKCWYWYSMTECSICENTPRHEGCFMAYEKYMSCIECGPIGPPTNICNIYHIRRNKRPGHLQNYSEWSDSDSP